MEQNSFGAGVERGNSLVQASSGGGKGNESWGTEALFLFQMSVEGDSESQEYAALQYMWKTFLIDTISQTPGRVS